VSKPDINPQIQEAPESDRKKAIRRAVNHLHQFATDAQIKAVAAILNLKAEGLEENEPCTHTIVICKCCGKEGSAAQLMASRPRKRSPGAAEQSRQAVRKGMERKAADAERSQPEQQAE
jgi:hypothetical protein